MLTNTNQHAVDLNWCT